MVMGNSLFWCQITRHAELRCTFSGHPDRPHSLQCCCKEWQHNDILSSCRMLPSSTSIPNAAADFSHDVAQDCHLTTEAPAESQSSFVSCLLSQKAAASRWRQTGTCRWVWHSDRVSHYACHKMLSMIWPTDDNSPPAGLLQCKAVALMATSWMQSCVCRICCWHFLVDCMMPVANHSCALLLTCWSKSH